MRCISKELQAKIYLKCVKKKIIIISLKSQTFLAIIKIFHRSIDALVIEFLNVTNFNYNLYYNRVSKSS